jgi:hypothetical protein
MADNITLPPTGTSGTASPNVESIDITGAVPPASSGPQRQVVTIGDRAGSTNDVIGPINDTAAASDTAPSSLNGRLQRIAQNITSMISTLGTDITTVVTAITTLTALFPTSLTKAGALRVGGTLATPSSVLTRPANTTAYAQNELIANSVTAGSVVVPSFQAIAAAGGSGAIKRARLITNASSGLGSISFHVDFWSAAPTFANGDGGAYAPATGNASWLGSMTFSGLTQFGDGASGAAIPNVSTDISFVLASSTNIFWSLQCTSATGFTPISGETFTLIPEILQD